MLKKKGVKPTKGFESITISLSSPDEILERSFGEVLKPETINYVLTNLKEMVCFVKEYSVL
jgi:DNA-directed RNA polymerase subunit beta'